METKTNIQKKDIYKKENTYVVISDGTYMRWKSSGKLFYAGSHSDAIEGLEHLSNIKSQKIIDSPMHIQKEYESLIDELNKKGEL